MIGLYTDKRQISNFKMFCLMVAGKDAEFFYIQFEMHEELIKKLHRHLDRLVNELDVSVSLLASLLAKEVIDEENKAAIQVRYRKFGRFSFENSSKYQHRVSLVES